MALFRYIFVPLLTLAALVVGAALAIPHFLDVDRHLKSVLEQVNRRFPGTVGADRAELELFPRIGVHLENLRAEFRSPAGPGVPLLTAETADLRLGWRTLFRPERDVEAEAGRAVIRVTRVASSAWNAQTFLRPTTPSVEPTPLPHLPAYLRQKKPKERSSFFEDLRLRTVHIDSLLLEIDPGTGTVTGVPLRRAEFVVEPAEWKISASVDAASTDLARTVSECGGPAGSGSSDVTASVSASSIRIESWRTPQGGPVWTGRVGWNGDVDLHSKGKRISGILPALRCGP